MKRNLNLFLSVFVLFLTSSCSLLTNTSDYGVISLQLPGSNQSRASRAVVNNFDVKFKIKAINQKDEKITEQIAEEGDACSIKVEQGIYTVVVDVVSEKYGIEYIAYTAEEKDVTVYTGRKTDISMLLENKLSEYIYGNKKIPVISFENYYDGYFYLTDNFKVPMESDCLFSKIQAYNYSFTPDGKNVCFVEFIDNDNDKHTVRKYNLSTKEKETVKVFEYSSDIESLSCYGNDKVLCAFKSSYEGTSLFFNAVSINGVSISYEGDNITTDCPIVSSRLVVDTINKIVYVAVVYQKNMNSEPPYGLSVYAASYSEIFTDGGDTIKLTEWKSKEFLNVPIYRKIGISNIKLANDGVYLLTTIYSCNTSSPSEFISYGNIYFAKYENGNVNVEQIYGSDPSTPVLEGTGDAINHHHFTVYANTSKEGDVCLFGPRQLLAVTPKKLVFIDSGFFVYEEDGYLHQSNRINRLVEIDLRTKLIDYIDETEFLSREEFESIPFSQFFIDPKGN